jgi:dTDP-4-dehydrorhamnose 3,5-epimerase-like enzyme
VKIIEPKVFGDKCGYFMESFSLKNREGATGLKTNFLQIITSVRAKVSCAACTINYHLLSRRN